MRPTDTDRVTALLTARLGEASPVDARVVVHATSPRPTHPALVPGRLVSASILARGADLVVFGTPEGAITGWRDDGRLGAARKPDGPASTTLSPDQWRAIAAELERPDAVLRACRAVFLDPIGWTLEARCRVGPGLGQAWRVWMQPASHRVLQVYRPQPTDWPIGARTPLAPGPLVERALALVATLLQGRLRRAGLAPDPLARYASLAVTGVEPFADGVQVRVATWRHWSDAMVEFDGVTEAVQGWRIDRLADDIVRGTPAARTAIAVATMLAPLPPSAGAPHAMPVPRARPPRSWQVEWSHLVHGVPVIGDLHQVEFHPDTRRLIGVRTRWSTVDVRQSSPTVEASAAWAIAEAERLARGMDDSLQSGPPSLCFVRPMEDIDPRHRLAWRVGFADGAGTVDLYIDALDGRVLGSGGHR